MDQEITKAIYYCMCALTSIDGEVHPNELIVLHRFYEDHNLKDLKYHPNSLDSDYQKCLAVFKESFSYILDNSDTSTIFDLLHHLNEVADADNNLDDREESLIHLIQESIGKNISIGKEYIEWNDQQNKVLDCLPSERVIVPAPPGAGKTELIAAKVYDLINNHNIRPREILLISFTNSAVREMQERIFLYSKDGEFPSGLNISTIDSKAFNLNKNIRDDYKIKGGYEKNINDFLELIKNGSVDFLENWHDLKHIFIDEAQDLVSLRKDVCDEFIRLSSKETGISIFGDPCQQIYPWKVGKKPLTEEDKESLMDLIDIKYKKDFREIELSTIHRTDNIFLKEMLDDMRLNIYVMDDNIPSPLGELDLIDENIMNIHAADDYLFLFRSNSEVVDAAYNLNVVNKIYRLKSTGDKYPKYLKSWLSKFINYCHAEGIEEVKKANFLTFAPSISTRHTSKISPTLLWYYLLKYAKSNIGEISVNFLIEALNSKKPPFEFLNEDFGFRGPKLSTVHASKGSQSENVILNNWDKSSTIDKDESKVVFVGISRAQKNLQISNEKRKRYNLIFQNKEIVNNHARQILKRYYRLINKKEADKATQVPVYLMEVGLKNDFDPMSMISNKHISYKDALETQKFLKDIYLGNKIIKCDASRLHFIENEFHISAKCGDQIFKMGNFSSQVMNNIRTISHTYLKNSKLIEPMFLDNLSILDIASYVIDKDAFQEGEESNYFTPFIEAGTFLYPVIYGSSRFSLKHYSDSL